MLKRVFLLTFQVRWTKSTYLKFPHLSPLQPAGCVRAENSEGTWGSVFQLKEA
jgi:hypothetical protein